VGLIQTIGRGPVALDSCCFIYFIEDHARFAPILEPLFRALEAGTTRGVTSALTLLEVLVVPYRVRNEDVAKSYEAILTRSKGLSIVDIDRVGLRSAAMLRARYPRLRTPDALQLVAALAGRCTALVTNDRSLPGLPGLHIHQLDAYA
jgi:predicted nucleic acid-binding protein